MSRKEAAVIGLGRGMRETLEKSVRPSEKFAGDGFARIGRRRARKRFSSFSSAARGVPGTFFPHPPDSIARRYSPVVARFFHYRHVVNKMRRHWEIIVCHLDADRCPRARGSSSLSAPWKARVRRRCTTSRSASGLIANTRQAARFEQIANHCNVHHLSRRGFPIDYPSRKIFLRRFARKLASLRRHRRREI